MINIFQLYKKLRFINKKKLNINLININIQSQQAIRKEHTYQI